jgi:hypothetical protein
MGSRLSRHTCENYTGSQSRSKVKLFITRDEATFSNRPKIRHDHFLSLIKEPSYSSTRAHKEEKDHYEQLIEGGKKAYSALKRRNKFFPSSAIYNSIFNRFLYILSPPCGNNTFLHRYDIVTGRNAIQYNCYLD